MRRETGDKLQSSFFCTSMAVQGRSVVMVFYQRVVAVEGVLVEDWMVHRGGALLRGSVHRGCVVDGRIVNQILGDRALQRGGQTWSIGELMAGRRQHYVMEMGRLVKQWWPLVMVRIGREAGVGAAIEAARGRVGTVEVWLANRPTGGDTIMALLVGHSWEEWAIGGC